MMTSDIDDAIKRAEKGRGNWALRHIESIPVFNAANQTLTDTYTLAAEVKRLREVRWAVERQHQPADFEPGMCVTCLVTMPCPTLVALG